MFGYRLFPIAFWVGIAAVVIFGFGSQYTPMLDCDGYGNYCAYGQKFSIKSFERNETEQVTYNRAAEILQEMEHPNGYTVTNYNH